MDSATAEVVSGVTRADATPWLTPVNDELLGEIAGGRLRRCREHENT
jgi:hypothetical protein